jgi:hypothetical protein
MATVTISKKEYRELLEKKLRYEYLRQIMEADIFAPPSTRNHKEILAALRKTKKYNQEFLQSVARGLERSSYFKQ